MTEQDYPWIRKWGQLLGSYSYYIDEQVELARQEGAPQTAIHPKIEYRSGKRIEGEWTTIDDVVSENTRRQLGLPPLNTPEVE